MVSNPMIYILIFLLSTIGITAANRYCDIHTDCDDGDICTTDRCNSNTRLCEYICDGPTEDCIVTNAPPPCLRTVEFDRDSDRLLKRQVCPVGTYYDSVQMTCFSMIIHIHHEILTFYRLSGSSWLY